jgi:hypothetical protein
MVYIDETQVQTYYNVKKCWQHDTLPGVMMNSCAEQRMIAIHAG